MVLVITEKDFRDMYQLDRFSNNTIKKLDIKFPIHPNKNLAKIVSYLTFDGHLTPNYRMFLFTSGKQELLREPQFLIKKEFKVIGKFKKVITNTYSTSYEYRICNGPLGRILFLLGVPLGDKIKTQFRVPDWIKNNTEFSREYLKVAFECEGSFWEEKDGRKKIRFRINKAESLLENGILFINDMKRMLSKLGVDTSNIWISNSNKRKDGIITKTICFEIKLGSIKKFLHETKIKGGQK